MLIQTSVGPVVSAAGTTPVLRSGSLGDAYISELHGPKFAQSNAGNMFAVANQAVVTTTAGLATTWTGLAISNPAGSGVNAVVNLFTVGQVAVGVAGAVGIMTGSGAAAGALVPRNRIVGNATGRVTASNSATIATPVLEYTFGNIGSLATTGYGLTPGLVVDLGGSLIIPPGFYAATYTTAATTSALVFSFQWEEVPIAVV